MATLRVLLRRRPITSLSLIGSTGLVSYAAGVEYRTEQLVARQQSRRLIDDKDDVSSSISTAVLSLPRQYDWEDLRTYWSARPLTVWSRFAQIIYELGPVMGSCVKDLVVFAADNKEEVEAKQLLLASRLREALTNLGPAFVKAGQQLSIRPDLVPPVVLKELQKLCDAVRSIPDDVALQIIREELDEQDLDRLFQDIRLVASASLGQVYKAKLRDSGKEVAIKVQRPNTRKIFSLDLFLLHRLGFLIDNFTAVFTQQPQFHSAFYESFARGSYAELDYENEALNQIRFQKSFAERNLPVVVPDVYQKLSTERVLTTQWIDGIKLADSPKDQIRKLIPVGIELFLTQLLDIGAFHADPHPGNLLVTSDGKLCLLDFGLCAEIDLRTRNAMTKAIAHLVSRDFDTLVAHDTKELGLLPEDYDTAELMPIMTKILTVGVVESGSDLRKRKRKLMEISNELNEVFFRYPFSVPPFVALVTRMLCLLEGIALTGDPDFDIFQASAPYARRRALAVLGVNTFRKMTKSVNMAGR
jgi:aarF domain-containing kinase